MCWRAAIVCHAITAAIAGCGVRTGLSPTAPTDAAADVASLPLDAGERDADPGFFTCADAGAALDCDAGVAYFDRGAAACALHLVPVTRCREPDGPTGAGHVKVRFGSNGSVLSVDVDQPPFAGTPTATCLVALFSRVRIAPYCGDPMTIGLSVSL